MSISEYNFFCREPTTKKRETKALDKEKRKKELNNARARRSRLKKKKHFENLEEKVTDLENQLAEKDMMIQQLSHKLQQVIQASVKQELSKKEYEQELLNECQMISESLPKNKDFKAKELELAEKFSAFGSERIKIMESAFTTIIENLYPDEYKILFRQVDFDPSKRAKWSEKDENGRERLPDLSEHYNYSSI